MLFDYRKGTDVVSLAGIISWLETKNPDEKYQFMDCSGGCFFSQYLQDRLGLPKTHSVNLGEHLDTWKELHSKYWSIACDFRDGARSTFRAALRRAREFVE